MSQCAYNGRTAATEQATPHLTADSTDRLADGTLGRGTDMFAGGQRLRAQPVRKGPNRIDGGRPSAGACFHDADQRRPSGAEREDEDAYQTRL